MNCLPIIAIIGRPNVGKSTLFNRLIGKRLAVTSEIAGTTRDRIHQKIEISGYETLLVDTGGIATESKGTIEENVQAQAKIAISEADLIIFLVDITQDFTADDFKIANILRKSHKHVILIANKCDNEKIEKNLYNIYELGFGEAIAISSIHKKGIEELIEKIGKNLKSLKFKKEKEAKIEEEKMTNLCILGKPNAGKSSLVNALFGSERVIVSEIPGTTRDSIDTEVVYNDKKYNLIDTAGIRRPGKIDVGIEKFSILRCFNSIETADITILMIDSEKTITNQDCHIVEDILKAGKGLIIAINKIDLIEGEEEIKERIISMLQRKMVFVPWAPIVFMSAKNKKNIYEIFNLADQIMEEREKRIKTPELNSFLQKTVYKHLPASRKIKKPKFMYASQIDTSPPKFVIFMKHAETLHFSYPRYLENQIRKEYGFNGTPIELKFKSQEPDPKTKSKG